MRPPDFILFVVPGIADVRKGDHLDVLGKPMPARVYIEISSAVFDISMIDDSLPVTTTGETTTPCLSPAIHKVVCL